MAAWTGRLLIVFAILTTNLIVWMLHRRRAHLTTLIFIRVHATLAIIIVLDALMARLELTSHAAISRINVEMRVTASSTIE